METTSQRLIVSHNNGGPAASTLKQEFLDSLGALSSSLRHVATRPYGSGITCSELISGAVAVGYGRASCEASLASYSLMRGTGHGGRELAAERSLRRANYRLSPPTGTGSALPNICSPHLARPRRSRLQHSRNHLPLLRAHRIVFFNIISPFLDLEHRLSAQMYEILHPSPARVYA